MEKHPGPQRTGDQSNLRHTAGLCRDCRFYAALAAFSFFSLLRTPLTSSLRKRLFLPKRHPQSHMNGWCCRVYQTLEIVLIFLVPILTICAASPNRKKETGTFEHTALITSPLECDGDRAGQVLSVRPSSSA